jgi:hypothetical protein
MLTLSNRWKEDLMSRLGKQETAYERPSVVLIIVPFARSVERQISKMKKGIIIGIIIEMPTDNK